MIFKLHQYLDLSFIEVKIGFYYRTDNLYRICKSLILWLL